MARVINPPDKAELLTLLLSALPAAASSTQPASRVLELLSPIMRERVRAFADSSTKESWLRFLCWDAAKAIKVVEIVQDPMLEPHPVSGEVEVDWECDSETRYKRLDRETLQALVAVPNLGLAFRLEYCVNDSEGGDDGWRVAEILPADQPSPFSIFGGFTTIADAEGEFTNGPENGTSITNENGYWATRPGEGCREDAEGDDDNDYWARYDATPARTPAQHHSPAPAVADKDKGVNQARFSGQVRPLSAEDEYFAQYDDVQPAMDNHDPDEEVQAAEMSPMSMLVEAAAVSDPGPPKHLHPAGTLQLCVSPAEVALQQPRPESDASSSGSNTIAKLEENAEKQQQSEFGVRQHISRSIKSLYVLSRASGIDRDDFQRQVLREMAVLEMMDEEE